MTRKRRGNAQAFGDRTPAAQDLMMRVGETLARNFALIQEEQLLNQKELAERCGYATTHLREMFSGKANLTLASLADFAKGLGMFVDVTLTPTKPLMQKRAADLRATPAREMPNEVHAVIAYADIPTLHTKGGTPLRMVHVRTVLHYIATQQGVWMGQDTICRACCLSNNHVRHILHAMIAANLLERESRPPAGIRKGAPHHRYRVRAETLRLLPRIKATP